MEEITPQTIKDEFFLISNELFPEKKFRRVDHFKSVNLFCTEANADLTAHKVPDDFKKLLETYPIISNMIFAWGMVYESVGAEEGCHKRPSSLSDFKELFYDASAILNDIAANRKLYDQSLNVNLFVKAAPEYSSYIFKRGAKYEFLRYHEVSDEDNSWLNDWCRDYDKNNLKIKKVYIAEAKKNELDDILEDKLRKGNGAKNSFIYKEAKQILDDLVETRISSFTELEDKNTEYKSSILHYAKNNSDPMSQLQVIISEIAAFMNTSGGTLIIGVNDSTLHIDGIEKDISELPDFIPAKNTWGKSDKQYYKATRDHYKQAIIEAFCYFTGTQTYTDKLQISFPSSSEDKTYAEIKIAPTDEPIWIAHMSSGKDCNNFFIRQESSKKQIYTYDINKKIKEIYDRNKNM